MKKDLLDFMAEACHYAQDHTTDWEHADPNHQNDWVYLFECTSHMIACFIAQNTVNGGEGVESCFILDELIKRPNPKSVKDWKAFLKKYVEDYGGFKEIKVDK
jgi:hypothetical protein